MAGSLLVDNYFFAPKDKMDGVRDESKHNVNEKSAPKTKPTHQPCQSQAERSTRTARTHGGIVDAVERK